MDVIEAYTCANDVSARDFQFGDGQWFRGKGLDGFCPVGPQLVDAAELDMSDLRIQQRLNGEVLQDARTSEPDLHDPGARQLHLACASRSSQAT